MEQLELLYIAGGMQNATVILENNLVGSEEVKYLPYVLIFHSEVFIQKKIKTNVHIKICTRMFIVVLFMISPNSNVPQLVNV